MEECWDHDSEARLTAVCVEERILDMMALWAQDSKQKGGHSGSPGLPVKLHTLLELSSKNIFLKIFQNLFIEIIDYSNACTCITVLVEILVRTKFRY